MSDPLPLPDKPDLNWLRKQAKRHLKELRDTHPSAQLADAQFALAKQYGFSSWRALKAHVDSLTVDPVVSAALAQAERSSPPVKAAALLHIARVVNAFDHAEAERVLERGIAAAGVLREPDRSVIMGQAVSLAATVSPERAIRLAPFIESDDMPGSHMSKALFDMISHGHADAAVKYLTSLSADEDYPFDAALQAIGHSKNDATRLHILRSAIRAVRGQANSGRRSGRVGPRGGFSFLFTRWWRLLPADEAGPIVRDLVQMILEEPDETTRASWNEARFSSSREHRLFEIYGPLRHLAPELAESFVAQYPQLAAAVKRYPHGDESLKAPAQDAADYEPLPGPLSELVEQPDYVLVGERLMPIPDALRTDFKEAFDLALRAYATDADLGRPNDAPQECWPSAQEFRTILYKAGQHEGPSGARHLDRIPDPNLRLFAQIEFAAALVGLPQVGGRIISTGPYGFRHAMAMRARGPHPPPHMPPAPIRCEPPSRRPDVSPSYEARITPTRRAPDEGPAGGSGPDFWVIQGARLRPVLSHLYDQLETRIDLPPSLDSNRYDFTLVLPTPVGRETMVRLMREGIERHFLVAREVRSMEADVLTVPDGISTVETYDNDRKVGFGFGSIGFAQMSPGGPPAIPERLMLQGIMDLHIVPPETSSTGEEEMRAMKSRFRRGLGFYGSGVQITEVSDSLTMAQLCEVLEPALDRPLIDETRRSGTYAINVHSEARSTREFLRLLCDKLGLAITTSRREVSMLVVRQS
jgi:uncharacterized protein (TIGR03435 family)